MSIIGLTSAESGGQCFVNVHAVEALHDDLPLRNDGKFRTRVFLFSGSAVIVEGTPQEVRDALFGRPQPKTGQ